jgi:hypothetical protein
MAGEYRLYWLSGQALCITSTGAALRVGRGKTKGQRRSGRGKKRRETERKENSETKGSDPFVSTVKPPPLFE